VGEIDEQGGSACDKHMGPETGWFIGNFPLNPDDAPEDQGQAYFTDNHQLLHQIHLNGLHFAVLVLPCLYW
jgi:hypothetical protein